MIDRQVPLPKKNEDLDTLDQEIDKTRKNIVIKEK
jgi:hypothetical protein